MKRFITIKYLSLMSFLGFSLNLQTPTVGTSVEGDFDGDGSKEYAFLVLTEKGGGHPLDGGTADKYSIKFSSNDLKSLPIGCCEARLVNEGDLTNNGTDELSIYQAPVNGNTYTMTTYSFINGDWKVLFDPFLIPTGGDYLSDEELQSRVFLQGDSIYYYDVDVNDENSGLIKKKATLH